MADKAHYCYAQVALPRHPVKKFCRGLCACSITLDLLNTESDLCNQLLFEILLLFYYSKYLQSSDTFTKNTCECLN